MGSRGYSLLKNTLEGGGEGKRNVHPPDPSHGGAIPLRKKEKGGRGVTVATYIFRNSSAAAQR